MPLLRDRQASEQACREGTTWQKNWPATPIWRRLKSTTLGVGRRLGSRPGSAGKDRRAFGGRSSDRPKTDPKGPETAFSKKKGVLRFDATPCRKGSCLNALDRSRTCNPRFRRPMLYPIELRVLTAAGLWQWRGITVARVGCCAKTTEPARNSELVDFQHFWDRKLVKTL